MTSAVARLPVRALGSVWVSRVPATTNASRRSGESAKNAPIGAARIAGPLPAERTPLLAGEKPSQRRTIERSVPSPIPAGKDRNHQRRLQAKRRAKASTEAGCASRAWLMNSVCSVSSLSIPRPAISRCRQGLGNRRLIRRRDTPSAGSPSASPTAVPMSTPRNRS